MVCAHTSAGKTVCAEHAVAVALRDKQRVVYTSPIKALSNQKYRELTSTFGDVGLITGDTTLNEEASCLVMTTEILRILLYKGSTVMREIKWVIFDEAHLLGTDRGWVIEECLILLPRSVRSVLLSATLPNALEVAEWVSSLNDQPVHVVHTSARPTPLRHYVWPTGGSGMYLVQDEHGAFREAAWQNAVSSLPPPRPPKRKQAESVEVAAEPSTDTPRGMLRRAEEVVRVAATCRSSGMMPAIIFCFSRHPPHPHVT